MSAVTRATVEAALPDVDPWDVAAVSSLAAASGASLAVLYHVTDVTGTGRTFLALVGLSVALAVAARRLTHLQATGLALVLLAAGLGLYLTAVPPSYLASLSVDRVVTDVIALLTGFPVLRLPAAGTWALAVAPGPIFLAWYFGARQEFVRGATIAGATLGFFVLTGDSGATGTLVGVLGATGAVAFSTLGRHGGTRRHLELVAFVLAVMIVASATVTAVPGGRSPLLPTSSAPGSLVSADNAIGIGGSISLSPTVSFVVESEEPRYWRVAVYDRYVGDGWVRTGDPASGGGGGGGTAGVTRTVVQHYTAKRVLDAIPAAARPVSVDGVDAVRTGFGDYVPRETLRVNDTYTVRSEIPVTTELALRTAGTDYPEEIRERYLAAPATTQRVRDLAARITRNANTPYAKATAIATWLETTKEYSLDAPAPSGNVVDSFLFELHTGYCTYYASAMVVMLRTQGVPARFVTGYTTGQRVSEDTWVVRGVDSHAWVEVYFPDVGWVRFDPTPAAPRATEETSIVTTARENGVDVDAAGSQNGIWTPPDNSTDGSAAGEDTNEQGIEGRIPRSAPSIPGANSTPAAAPQFDDIPDPAGPRSTDPGIGLIPALPDAETVTVWSVLAAGLAAGLHRSGLPTRARRWLWLRTTPSGTPRERVEGAYDRVAHVLARHARPRSQGETVREYLDAIGAPGHARDVAALRERARYRTTATPEDAQRATRLAKQVVTEPTRIAGIGRGDNV